MRQVNALPPWAGVRLGREELAVEIAVAVHAPHDSRHGDLLHPLVVLSLHGQYALHFVKREQPVRLAAEHRGYFIEKGFAPGPLKIGLRYLRQGEGGFVIHNSKWKVP